MRSGARPSSFAEAMRALRVGRQRAGDELVLVVHARREAMHRADEGALPAADHAERIAAARPASVVACRSLRSTDGAAAPSTADRRAMPGR